ncbi:Hypothetical predicted protein [Paramuricea clavata]|uniref:FP protein C-terminal domain-containing protein n=1 Tax=Paramuricea clavata TaxID=317549 RepID=A0A7D9DC42_PARCT|nr:Hypothetical predicted protein [Paramuricea clavata]
MSLTRSKGAATAMKVEIEAILKSEEFQQLLQSTIQVAVSAALVSMVEPINEKISVLEEKVATLESHLTRALSMANNNEQYSRRHNVRILGFVEEKGENCVKKILNFFNEKLGVAITDENIDRAHRVSKPNDNKPGAIIVRFKAHKDKIAILRKGKDLFHSKSNFYVNKDLTKINQKLLYSARKECLNAASAWTTDSKIFVKRISDAKIFIIKATADFTTYELL